MAESRNKVVADKAEEVQPLMVGDSIPDGKLKSIEGKRVDLLVEILKKPTILIFYRGGWCPYCNAQMGQLVKIEPKLVELGYQVLAISPDKPAKLKETLNKQHINYTLLSDSPMEVTKKFGLAFKVSKETLEKYKEYHIDLDGASGEHHHLLPVPAAYVIDQKGIIRYAYFNPDYKVRINPDELLKAAQGGIGLKP